VRKRAIGRDAERVKRGIEGVLERQASIVWCFRRGGYKSCMVEVCGVGAAIPAPKRGSKRRERERWARKGMRKGGEEEWHVW